MNLSEERIAVLGASRGLGRAFVETWLARDVSAGFFLLARKTALLEKIQLSGRERGAKMQIGSFDFSSEPDQDKVLEALESFRPTRLLYFAAGGPYGPFASKSWSSHQWAWRVTFEFPARLLHQALQDPLRDSVQQLILIGSSIAEEGADPNAASYCAAKHALHGLVQTLHEESESTESLDLRLFSPGYLDTELLPPNAEPRQKPGRVRSPHAAAQALYEWMLDPGASRHYKWQ